MKREVALAVVVGALAGLLGAYSARRDAPEASERADVAAGEPSSESAPVRAALSGRVVQKPDLPALLRVQVKPPSAVALRLARWSLRAGPGSDGDWLQLPEASTDAAGRAEVALKPGTYWVGAGGAHTQVELSSVTDVELELGDAVRLTGRVLGAGTERPIAGALVVASPGSDAPESEKQTTQTDGLGRFAFQAVPKGDLDLQISARGWATSEAKAEAPGSLDVHLEESCRLDGIVVGGEGASVGGVRPADPATIASAGGRFWLELECGLGHTLIARDAVGRIGYAAVAPRQKTVTLRLEPGSSLAGTVRSADGAPVQGAEVAAMFGDDDVRARTVSDERGTFTLSALLPGSYVVRARKGRGTSGAVYGHEVPAKAPVEVVVEAGAVLEGEVLGADDPIAVEVTWPSLRHERPVRAHTMGGRFRFDDLPIGAGRVTATTAGRSGEQTFMLTAGATQSVRLELEGVGRIVGRVIGAPEPQSVVIAYRTPREREVSRIRPLRPDGSFALEVPPGEYKVFASGRVHVRRLEQTVVVREGKDTVVELEVQEVDAGLEYGAMPSVAQGEIGASFEVVNGAVQVSWVVGDSPTSAAGVRVGDVVTAVDGRPVITALDAFAGTRGAPGTKVALTIRRDGVERTAQLRRAP